MALHLKMTNFSLQQGIIIPKRQIIMRTVWNIGQIEISEVTAALQAYTV